MSILHRDQRRFRLAIDAIVYWVGTLEGADEDFFSADGSYCGYLRGPFLERMTDEVLASARVNILDAQDLKTLRDSFACVVREGPTTTRVFVDWYRTEAESTAAWLAIEERCEAAVASTGRPQPTQP